MNPVFKLNSTWISPGIGVAVLGGYLAHAWRFWMYVNDDAYITFRYSLFLALGRGPYYNLDQHVEGYTNFLLMLLIAGVIRLFGPEAAPLAAKLIGVLGGLLALWAAWALTARWLRKLDSISPGARGLAWAAPALVAVSAAFALNSVSGLETALFSGWLLLGLYLLQRSADDGRWRGAGISFALAALTRPEGLVAFVAAGLGRVLAGAWHNRAERSALGRDTLVVAVSVGAHLAFRWAFYDGELLPNTYYAKTGGLSWILGADEQLLGYVWAHAGGFACVAALLPLLARSRAVPRATLPALLVCAAAVIGLLKTGPDWMIGYRLLVPYAPVWAALSVCGIAALADRIGRRTLPAAIGGAVILLVLVVAVGERGAGYLRTLRAAAHGYEVGHVALGRWLHAAAQPGDMVTLMDVGLVGYLNPDLHVLDISGLTDRHIGQSPGAFLRKQYDPAYVLGQRPAYIVIVVTQGPDHEGRLQYVAWTPMEERLSWHPEFLAHYYRPCAAPPGADDLQTLAAAFGAERVFRHADPKKTYLLAVYVRQEAGRGELAAHGRSCRERCKAMIPYAVP